MEFARRGIKVGTKCHNITSGFFYKLWCVCALTGWICYKLSVRSRGTGTVLINSSDSILKSILGQAVSCHTFHRVSILWKLGLGVRGLRVGGVLQPSGQRCPRLSLFVFRLYTCNTSYSMVFNSIRRYFFKSFCSCWMSGEDCVDFLNAGEGILDFMFGVSSQKGME